MLLVHGLPSGSPLSFISRCLTHVSQSDSMDNSTYNLH